jgi:hypothetical protein
MPKRKQRANIVNRPKQMKKQNGDVKRPSFKLKVHQQSVINQAAGNDTNRVIITPTLATFPAAVSQAAHFQQYKITKI